MDWLNRLLDILVFLLFNFEEKKIDNAMLEAEDAKLKLKLLENHDDIEKEFDDVDDRTVVNGIIRAGGGTDSDTI